MKKITSLFILLIGLVVIAGCSTKSTENTINEDVAKENAKEGGDIWVATGAQPPTLDTHVSSASATRDVGQHIFETLVTLNSNYQAVPMLAESVEVSEDNKTYTFYLREGVIFHNGKEMTSEDVVASMERWKNHDAMALSLVK